MNGVRFCFSRISSCRKLLIRRSLNFKCKSRFLVAFAERKCKDQGGLSLCFSIQSCTTFIRYSNHKASKEYRMNNAIQAKNVRLIDKCGTNLGIVPLANALEKGKISKCMVVEVGHNKNETICKLFSQKQLFDKRKEDKKKQVKTSKTKEIKITAKISEHDLEMKMRKIIEFLEGNDSVKVLVSHRRRQNSSIDEKKDLIEKIAANVTDVGSLQGDVKIIGNNIRTLFVPIQKK